MTAILAKSNLGPYVVPLLHHFRHGGELRLIAPLPGGVEGERGSKIIKPIGIERLDDAHRFVAPIALGRRCRRAEGETGLAETLRSELPVIGDRHAGGVGVETLGRLGLAHRLGGAALPIGRACDGQRVLGGGRRERKPLRGQRSVVKEAQGDPAGVEGGVDLSLGGIGPHGLIADFKCKARLIEIEKRTSDHLPLAPPSIPIDERVAVSRRKTQHDRRFVNAPCAARVLDPGEQETGIVAERGRNRLDQGRAHRLASRRDAGLGEREDVGAGKRRSAGASAEIARIEQAVGAIGVVGLGERDAEIAQDHAFGQGVEIAVAPKARMICDASSGRPIACAARAAAILPALDCGGSLAKNAATSAGACGCAASSASCRSRTQARLGQSG